MSTALLRAIHSSPYNPFKIPPEVLEIHGEKLTEELASQTGVEYQRIDSPIGGTFKISLSYWDPGEENHCITLMIASHTGEEYVWIVGEYGPYPWYGIFRAKEGAFHRALPPALSFLSREHSRNIPEAELKAKVHWLLENWAKMQPSEEHPLHPPIDGWSDCQP